MVVMEMESPMEEVGFTPFFDISMSGLPRRGWWRSGTLHLLHWRSFFFGRWFQADGNDPSWFPHTSQRHQEEISFSIRDLLRRSRKRILTFLLQRLSKIHENCFKEPSDRSQLKIQTRLTSRGRRAWPPPAPGSSS